MTVHTHARGVKVVVSQISEITTDGCHPLIVRVVTGASSAEFLVRQSQSVCLVDREEPPKRDSP